jgi:TldD protein
MNRRDFLSRAAAGGAVLTMPAFLAGCGVQSATVASEPVPDNPFLDWFGIDQATIRQVMSALTGQGADLADLYFQHSRTNSILYEGGVVSNAESAIDQGVGLRVIAGDHNGYAFTEDLSPASMLAAASTASTAATGIAVTVPRAYRSAEPGDLYTVAVPWSGVEVEQKTSLFQYVEQKAKSLEPAVEKVALQWRDADERILIATHDGRLFTDRRPMSRMTVVVTAKRGEQVQSGFASIAVRGGLDWYTDERLDEVAEEAVSRAMVLFDARRPPEGEMPVILSAGTSGVLLHEAIGHAFEADYNRSGLSAYASKMGQRVADSSVTVIDDATMPNERGALNVDDEGGTTSRTVLVDKGVLNSYLHDKVSANHYGVGTTGSGRRESFRFAPMPRMSCTFIENGPHTNEEIIASVDRGVICETYLDGQVQLGEGDYTFNVRNGWLVEKGKVTAPLKNFTISGNGPELLRGISMVANDSKLDAGGWTCGKKGQNVPVSHGMPTVLASGVTLRNL